MTPDTLLVMATALGFAAVFLALVIGMAGQDAVQLASAVANLAPGARRQAQLQRLDHMTRMADDAIEARKLGKRLSADQIYG